MLAPHGWGYPGLGVPTPSLVREGPGVEVCAPACCPPLFSVSPPGILKADSSKFGIFAARFPIPEPDRVPTACELIWKAMPAPSAHRLVRGSQRCACGAGGSGSPAAAAAASSASVRRPDDAAQVACVAACVAAATPAEAAKPAAATTPAEAATPAAAAAARQRRHLSETQRESVSYAETTLSPPRG
jgi:hypothetical protein